MPHIPILPPDKAPKRYAVYEESYRRMSFPAPNFITRQGHSGAVVRGRQMLLGIRSAGIQLLARKGPSSESGVGAFHASHRWVTPSVPL